MRILLVDDEIVALNALKKRVDWMKYGFTDILTAQDAAMARELLGKQKIDLILCDVEMPGESGLSLVEYVRESHPDTTCIMVTCHAEFDYIKQAMRSRVVDYILKPIDYEELGGILGQFQQHKEAQEKRQKVSRIVEKAQEEKGYWEEDSAESRIQCVKDYIEEHIREKIKAAELAKLVHINEQYLMRSFKRETGQSLTEYIAQRRVAVASDLLKNTEYSVNFIADCVGCENYSYFTKLFKKYTGFTPREYRQEFQ